MMGRTVQMPAAEETVPCARSPKLAETHRACVDRAVAKRPPIGPSLEATRKSLRQMHPALAPELLSAAVRTKEMEHLIS